MLILGDAVMVAVFVAVVVALTVKLVRDEKPEPTVRFDCDGKPHRQYSGPWQDDADALTLRRFETRVAQHPKALRAQRALQRWLDDPRSEGMIFRSDRAQAIIWQIEKHPERWDQTLFRTNSCDTAFGFAGWAQVHAGKPAKTSMYCRHDAKLWLGLNDRQANYAFHSSRTLDELREFAKTGVVPNE